MSYQTIIETGLDNHWDDFLSGLKHSHHEQSTCWANVKKHQGWQAIRIKVVKGSDWLAGAQMLCRNLPLGGLVGYIPSGPFYRVSNNQSIDILIHSINLLAKEQRIQYIAITPYVENEHLDKILKNNGYSPTREKLPPISTTRATLILDLSKELDILLKDMRRETRREIKLALKSELTVREGDKKDLNTFFKLMLSVAERRDEKPIPNNIEFFNIVWDYFYPKAYVKILIVELRGEPVSTGIIFTFGNTVRFWKYGWSGEKAKMFPNQLLYWELIRWSKNNGFRYFDIVQVDQYVIDYLRSGLPATDKLKSRRLYGPTLYKIGFGGRILRFSGPWFRFQNPIIRYLFRYCGSSLMGIRYMQRLLSEMSHSI